MSRGQKLLNKMRNNPRGDWTIENLNTVAKEYNSLRLDSPRRGSHYTLSHPNLRDILTIPARRPLKPVYVKRFVDMIDSITSDENNSQ